VVPPVFPLHPLLDTALVAFWRWALAEERAALRAEGALSSGGC
jgi:hypothetical protein